MFIVFVLYRTGLLTESTYVPFPNTLPFSSVHVHSEAVGNFETGRNLPQVGASHR